MYYIMCATGQDNLYSGPQTLAGIAKEQISEDYTVLVCVREHGYGKRSPCFVVGSGHGYETEPVLSYYTQDTGHGHRNKNRELVIHNVIHMRGDKIISKLNDEGLSERRSVWVMK